MKVWRDGIWQELEENSLVGTSAFQFGFGLFETIRIKNNQALDIEDHLMRMTESMKVLDPEVSPIDSKEAITIAACAAKNYGDSNGVLKIIAYKNEEGWEMHFMARPFPYSPRDYEQGWSLARSSLQKNAKGLVVYHKTLNYLENYLERRRAQSKGFDDAYFLNTDGIITETTSGNIFILHDGALETSPVSAGMLPGTMRSKILREAPRLGIKVKENPINPETMAASDGVFVTNALLGAMPVSAIDAAIWFSIDSTFVIRLNLALGR